ncbi:CRISPR-associated helicase Cas3' [Candidatus Bathyarchaeota archaeon]|nr:CRISPR-associated helicase Cas3' [Candidatus Bathyarchaeota archaeon]
MEIWESFEKESHPGKTLLRHINEVKEYLTNFLNFYNFPNNFSEMMNYLTEYHDVGKLDVNWSLKNKTNPDHSPLSVKYVMNYKKVFKKEKNVTPILWYLILKHHSSLTKIIKDPNLQVLVKDVKHRVESLNFIYKINLVDAFGLFKIADVCSAENKSLELEKPRICEENIKKIISQNVDISRWIEQQKLAELPEIAMVRAYTGWGKTDASLLFFKNKDVNKIFYLFPTITAINKFYKKLRNVFNDNVIKYFYFFDTEVKDDLDLLQNIFFIENFIKPIVITTVDQFLLSFLQVGKYYKKRVMFRNSGIIVDEAHLLNPLMLRLFTFFIKKFQEIYRFKVLFMSATLPKSIKKYLTNELNLLKNSFLDFSNGYKLKRRVQFEYNDNNIETGIDNIIEEFKNNKKVLIVINTVEKSVTLAEELIKEVGKDNVILLHARFMYKDRRSKEERMDRLRKTPHILIATQVCEVSLDVSYDFLFTELAPISSLIQRFGRVNRYGDKIERTNVKIFKPDIKDSKRYPYTQGSLEVSRNIIKELEKEKLKSEMDLLDNFDRVYTYEEFIKELSEETKKIDLEAFEEFLQFFFSLDFKEEKLLEILNYRDGFTTLVVPAPECIQDIKLKNYVETILKEEFKNKNFVEKKQLFAKIKELSVPIPLWWLKGMIDGIEKVLPVVDFKDKVYDSLLGFRKIESEII